MDTLETPQGLRRRSASKLLWVAAAAAGLLLVALAFAPVVHGDTRQSVEADIAPMTTPVNRIDHSEIDWDKHIAEPDPSPRSVAAYGFGA